MQRKFLRISSWEENEFTSMPQNNFDVGRKLLKTLQSFYVDSRARVRVVLDVSGFWLLLDCALLGDVSMVV